MFIEYTIECLPEDTEVRGNYVVSGDDDYDKQCEDEVLRDLEVNPWAWCVVKVTAKIPGIPLEGTAYLGCCSYPDDEHFRDCAYYQDMKHEARENLVSQIEMVRALEYA